VGGTGVKSVQFNFVRFVGPSVPSSSVWVLYAQEHDASVSRGGA